MKQLPQYRVGRIADADIAALTFQETVHMLEQWAVERKDGYVCICNTHSIVTAGNHSEFHKALTKPICVLRTVCRWYGRLSCTDLSVRIG